MKIYITGGSGSGKTTYAKYLSNKYGIPHFDLDEIKWDNSSGRSYTVSRTNEERLKLLNEILQNNDNWICEGVYYKDWIEEMLKMADIVLILTTPRLVRQYRCLKRSCMSISIKSFSVIALWNLLVWNHKYDSCYLPLLLNKLKLLNIKYKFLSLKKLTTNK